MTYNVFGGMLNLAPLPCKTIIEYKLLCCVQSLESAIAGLRIAWSTNILPLPALQKSCQRRSFSYCHKTNYC